MAVEKKGKESQQKTFKQRVPDEAAENKRKARIWGKRAQNLWFSEREREKRGETKPDQEVLRYDQKRIPCKKIMGETK